MSDGAAAIYHCMCRLLHSGVDEDRKYVKRSWGVRMRETADSALYRVQWAPVGICPSSLQLSLFSVLSPVLSVLLCSPVPRISECFLVLSLSRLSSPPTSSSPLFIGHSTDDVVDSQ